MIVVVSCYVLLTLLSPHGQNVLFPFNLFLFQIIEIDPQWFPRIGVKGGVKRLNNHSPNIRTYNLQHLSP